MHFKLNTLRAQRSTGPGGCRHDERGVVWRTSLDWSQRVDCTVGSKATSLVSLRNPCSMQDSWEKPNSRRPVNHYSNCITCSCTVPTGQRWIRWSSLDLERNSERDRLWWDLCSVEVCRTVVGIISLWLIRRRSDEAADIRERSVVIRHELMRKTLSDNIRIWMMMNRMTHRELVTHILLYFVEITQMIVIHNRLLRSPE